MLGHAESRRNRDLQHAPQPREIRTSDQLVERSDFRGLLCGYQSQKARHFHQNLEGLFACGATVAQLKPRVAFREPMTIAVDNHRQMGKRRSTASEELREKDLARGRRQQICPADYLCNSHSQIIDDDRKLVGRHAITATQNKISGLARHILAKRALPSVEA